MTELMLTNKPIVEETAFNEILNDVNHQATFEENNTFLLRENNLLKASETNHKLLVLWASGKFANCHLNIDDDFNIYQDISQTTLGYFHCKLCIGYSTKPKSCKFSFNKCGTIKFKNIESHLLKHFQKLKIEKSHTVKSQMKPESNFLRNNSSHGIMDDNLKLANDQYVDFVIKMAAKQFEKCNLKVNQDFCLYQHKTFKTTGYFQCKICSEHEYCKISIKTPTTIIFSNIQSHLKKHFTSKHKPSYSRDMLQENLFRVNGKLQEDCNSIGGSEMNEIEIKKPRILKRKIEEITFEELKILIAKGDMKQQQVKRGKKEQITFEELNMLIANGNFNN